jgi:dihydropteroate synthase
MMDYTPKNNRLPATLNCKGKLIDLSKPVVMGILNCTPDSFYDGGKFTEESLIRKQIDKMISEGALLIDVGGMTSKPGSTEPTIDEEIKRVAPIISMIKQQYPDVLVSIDTYRSVVAHEAVNNGADMINDISGGDLDPEMFNTVAKLKVPYILMHMQGTPLTMQQNPSYENVVVEVFQSLQKRVALLNQLGVYDVIIDPGFGFGKTVQHNFELLRELQFFQLMNCPILVGISRKSMITKTLSVTPSLALNGTTVLNTIALNNGANILRVHDVKEAMECIQLLSYYGS